MPNACNFIKKESLAQLFSYEFWNKIENSHNSLEIFKNTFFRECLRATASAITILKKHVGK